MNLYDDDYGDYEDYDDVEYDDYEHYPMTIQKATLLETLRMWWTQLKWKVKRRFKPSDLSDIPF